MNTEQKNDVIYLLLKPDNSSKPKKIEYKKYDRFQKEKPKIPDITENSIEKLVNKMDYDLDGKISIEDIQQFC